MKKQDNSLKGVKKKGFLALISGIALIVLVASMTFAWYTKMTSISGLKFDVAKWEFNANNMTSDFYVDVFSYETIENKYAAPGTWGFLELELSPGVSQTDVEYTVQIDKTQMLEQFQDRIYVYFCTGTKLPTAKDYNCGKFEATVDLANNKLITENLVEFSKEDYISGTITRNSPESVYLYWHWVYDYAEYLSIGENKKDVYSDIYSEILETEITESNKTLFDDIYTYMESVDEEVVDDIYEYMQDNPMVAGLSAEEQDAYILEVYNQFIRDGATVSATEYQAKKDYYKGLFTLLLKENYKKINDTIKTNEEEFDKFDTEVGTNPALYKDYMSVQMIIAGTEANPKMSA